MAYIPAYQHLQKPEALGRIQIHIPAGMSGEIQTSAPYDLCFRDSNNREIKI